MKKYLLIMTACAAAVFAQVANAQPSAHLEYSQSISDGETTRLAMVLGALDKQNQLLKIALEKIGAGGYAQPAPVVQVAAPRTGWDVASNLFDRLLGATAVIAPVYAQYRTGQAQAAASIKLGEYSRDTSVATFGAFERTAGAGFAANANIASSGFTAATAASANLGGAVAPLIAPLIATLGTIASRPSTSITVGDGTTNIAGGNIATTRNCNGGTSGNGGAGGTTGSTTPATGIVGTSAPPTTTGGAGGATGAANGGNC